MKTAGIILLLHVCICSTLFSAQPPLKWGKISTDELNMTIYENDPQAPALILCDYGTIEVGPRTEYYRHVRIKILKKSGLKYATVEIPYKSYNHFDLVEGIKAQTINKDDKGEMIISKVKPKDYITEEIDSRNKKIIIVFANVKPGSIIEYKYTIKSLDLVKLTNWYFQSTIPTVLSDFSISIPRRFNYLVTYQKGRALDTDEQLAFAERIQWLYNTKLKKAHRELLDTKSLLYSSPKGTAKVYLSNGETMHFKMKDIPALQPKPEMFSFADNYPVVKAHLYYVDRSFGLPFYYRTILETARTDYGSWNPSRLYFDQNSGYILYWLPTWSEYNQNWLKDEKIGGRILKSFNYNAITDSILPDNASIQTLESLYAKVKSTLKWNGVYSMYATNDLNKVIKSGLGTSGEINILLISLLKRSGFEVNPVLIRTRNLGRIENMYPVSEQFNHVIAQVTINDQHLYIDATSSASTMYTLPENVQQAFGWLLRKENYGWVEVVNTKLLANIPLTGATWAFNHK